MGVKGLQTFLKNNQYYCSDKIILSDCDLVIDANNLLCLLFTKSCTDREHPCYKSDLYGGDLVEYGRIIQYFFRSLQECNIKPVLVFDGSVIGKHSSGELVASKEKEIYRRGLEKFNRAKTQDESSSDTSVLLPQIINIIFRNVVSQFNVRRVQTPYEADTHIARLANELDCHVLTNDSDFLIYPLKQGFLMLDYFNYKNIVTSKECRKGIPCLLFTQERLSRAVPGLSKETLPLLSILLGNDYVEPGTFDRVLEPICRGMYSGHLDVRSIVHRRIAHLLTWARGRSLHESIEYIVNSVHHTQQQKLKKVISMFLRNYRIQVDEDLESELKQIYPLDQCEPDTHSPSKFLKEQLEQKNLGSVVLDMIFHNTHYNYAILDDFTLPSSSYVKFRPFSLALVLLRPKSLINLTTYRRKLQLERDAFLIYDRIRGDYTKIIVRPMEYLEDFGTLEHLDCYTMIALEPALKKNILMACFRFNSDELNLMSDTVSHIFAGSFVPEATLCFILVKYIGLETKLAPKPQFVNALLITLFYYASLSNNLNPKIVLGSEKRAQLHRSLENYTTPPGFRPEDQDVPLYKRIMHFISMQQVAYKAYCLLNSLLDQVCHQPAQEKFFNSTLIFRLTKLFRKGELNIKELCKNFPSLVEICDSVGVQVHCCS